MQKPASPSMRSGRRPSLLVLCLAARRGAAAEEPSPATIDLDLPAGPLGPALLGIGRSAGVLLSFKPGLVDAHQAPPLRGRYTLKQALMLALQSSGLSFQITPSGVVTVVKGSGNEP